jgi:hypothetical protein
LNDDLFILSHTYYDNDTIEFLETEYFMIYIVHNDGKLELNIQLHVNFDVNFVAKFGLLISSFFQNPFSGFKFLEPYLIIENEKYLYGDEAIEMWENNIFKKKYIERVSENATYDFMKNIDINDIPSC